jgi:hypothetical protein
MSEGIDANQLAKTAKIPLQAARIALNTPHWKKWLDEKEEERKAKERLANLRLVSGILVQDRPENLTYKNIMAEMYEIYLRMAQMDQRSVYTFTTENGGKRVGKRVFDMTFDDYVEDGVHNLDWMENTDIPLMLQIEERGGIGTSKSEAAFSLQLIARMREAINYYFSLPEEQRLYFIE